MRGQEQPAEQVCETEVGRESEVEDKDVDIVCGVDEVGDSKYASKGFTLSNILRMKRLSRRRVSEAVVDNYHLPKCEFSNLRDLPLTYLLEIHCRQVFEFWKVSCAARWNITMTFLRCRVLVYDSSGEPVVRPYAPGFSQTDVSGSESKVGAPTSEEELEKKKKKRRAAKSPFTAVSERWSLSILPCRFWFRSLVKFSVVFRWYRSCSGVFGKRRCFHWRWDWWAVVGASHSCYQEPGIFKWGAQHDDP